MLQCAMQSYHAITQLPLTTRRRRNRGYIYCWWHSLPFHTISHCAHWPAQLNRKQQEKRSVAAAVLLFHSTTPTTATICFQTRNLYEKLGKTFYNCIWKVFKLEIGYPVHLCWFLSFALRHPSWPPVGLFCHSIASRLLYIVHIFAFSFFSMCFLFLICSIETKVFAK